MCVSEYLDRAGSPICGNHEVNVFARELVEQLKDLKLGRYLQEIENSDPIDVCVGVGG
jgi:hypothetical protein